MTNHLIGFALPPRRSARWVGVAMAALMLVAGTPLASILNTQGEPQGAVPVGAAVPAAALGGQAPTTSGTGLVSPDERVAFWAPRVAADPRDYLSALHLADAYLDRARATADLADLQRAQAALTRAAAAAPDPLAVVARQAQVAFALHEFGRAASLADEVLADAPGDLTALAVAGDARLETGDLAGARQRYHHLATLAPSAPVWSRLARLAFLEGDLSGALALVRRAIDDADANGFGDEGAFYRYQLGELHRLAGDLAAAAAAYEAALDAVPGYPAASIGLAMTLEGEGRRPEAIALLEAVTTRLPTPEAVAALGDLYLLAGDGAAAEREYALVERIGQVARATGGVYDRQLVLFAADHDRAVADAIVIAEAEILLRPDIYGFDALAWALYRGGRLEEAAAAAARATALGTPDPRLAYHAGMIAAAQGRDDIARELLSDALAGSACLPPLQVSVAERALAALKGVGE